MTELTLAGPAPAISEIAPAPLAAWLDARGEPAYRAAQILAGAHRADAGGFADLTDLPAALRAALEADFRFSTIEREPRPYRRQRPDRQGGAPAP